MSTAWGATFVPIRPAEPVEHPRRTARRRPRRLHRERTITGWLESVAGHLAAEARDQGVPLLAELPVRRPRRRPAATPGVRARLAGAGTAVAADGVLATAPASLV